MFCKALPEPVLLEQFGGDFLKFEDYLYSNIFLKTIKYCLKYEGKNVSVRRYPEFENKEDAFYHLTCKEENGTITDRVPDLRRAERLNWLNPALMSTHEFCDENCYKKYIKKKRIHLLNDRDGHLIVLEKRGTYILLITAFYIETNHTLRKKLKDYEKYCKDNAKSA